MTIKEFFEKQLREANISEDWRETFYFLASALLTDVQVASRCDALIEANTATDADLKASDSALRRISKISDVLETKMSPSLRRGAEIHAIMDQLRNVTVPTVADRYEVIEDKSESFVCIVEDTEPSDTVEMIRELTTDNEQLTATEAAAQAAAQQYYKQIREDELLGPLYEEAQRHWTPQATLQSLAVNIYLDRHGHIEENDRARWRETLRRDLRYMRRANLTVARLDTRGCKDMPATFTPGKNQV